MIFESYGKNCYKSHVIQGLHGFSPEANSIKWVLGLRLVYQHMEWEWIYPNMEDEADGESSRI